MQGTKSKATVLMSATALAVVVGTSTLVANHSWGKYHWARTSNPFTLKVGNNLNSGWSTYLADAIGSWNRSSVLQLTAVQGQSDANCSPTSGRIEACNGSYGENGWLGIASVWARGSHILQATTRVNDTYFNMPQYNSAAWRRFVMCQEIAHDFGLDHQDETFNNANVGSCMDYTNDPDGGLGGFSASDPSNEFPNQHDFDQLVTIYDHLDRSSSIGAVRPNANANANANAANQLSRGQFGQLVRSTNNGRTQLFVLDVGDGARIFTHVIWAE